MFIPLLYVLYLQTRVVHISSAKNRQVYPTSGYKKLPMEDSRLVIMALLPTRLRARYVGASTNQY